MQHFKPVYYDEFSCTAGSCPDTCCAGWQIMIDEESLEKYGEVQGSFGSRLRNSIDWMEGSFYQYDKRCAFLNKENLCDLYTELGPEALCDTCRRYPRHVEEFEGVREWSLSLSCPIAAQMLLSHRGEVELLEWETGEEENLDDFEDFDIMLYTQLVEARRLCLEKLWESPEIEAYMERCLSFAREMQLCVDEGEYFRLEEIVETYREKDWAEVSRSISYGEKVALFEEVHNLERLREEWDDVLSEMRNVLYHGGEGAYEHVCKTFVNEISVGNVDGKMLDNVKRQLLFFFLYTYFCGAVYDDWIYSKMALCIESVVFLQELFLARWIENGKVLTLEDCVELSYRYAREIEHSDINLNALEEYFMKKVE